MTYILDMAGGTEYLGEELSCPASGAPLQRRDEIVEEMKRRVKAY